MRRIHSLVASRAGRRVLLALVALLGLGSAGTLLGAGALRARFAPEGVQAASDTVVVYGPKRFDAGKGKPALHLERFTVAATPGVRYTLRLINGAADGSGRASRATVLLNGAEIIPASEFQKTSGALTRQVTLQGENTLEVTVEGPPASYVTLSVLQAPDPTFTVHGPRTAERGTASPTRLVERFTLSATAAPPYALHVTNGASDGSGRATSASIRINGQAVLSPSDLNPKVSGLIREVELVRENRVEVELFGEPGARITFRLTATDTTPPLIEIASPQPDLITNALRLEVSGSIRDETHTRVSVNDSTAARSGEGFSATVPLVTEGENPIRVRAVDAAGNRTDSVRVVIRDTEPPVITVSSPADGALTRDSLVAVSGTVRDMTAVKLNINGVPVSLDSAGVFHTVLPLVEGANFFTIAATDAAGNSSSQTRQVTRDSKPPVITVAEPQEGASMRDSTVRVSGTVEDASPVTLTLNGADVPLNDGAFTTSAALTVGSNALTLTATDAAGNTATATRTVTRESAGPPLPPDPATVAPQLDRTVATTTYAATGFLYTGDNPIQTGVAPGTISPVRVSVLRGKVLTREGEPLSGVAITVLNHPELGQTLSRADGAFDLAVNGGGHLTLNYAKAGHLPAQRQVHAPWQDYAHVDDVVLVTLDPQVTPVSLSGSSTEAQVARGSEIQDADGIRQATIIFDAGTTATLQMPDGSTRAVSSLNIRATEYTIGENGPEAMPAQLPPTTAYTYAVELSADEAITAGATGVQFSKPVAFYVENFLGFPVGTPVPVGYYDAQRAVWVPMDNGRVIKILSVKSGVAEIDANGDGVADGAESLASLGIDAAERERLTRTYAAGASLWRVQTTHFSILDLNWGSIITGVLDMLGLGAGDDDYENQDDPDCEEGSIIECQGQVLGERVGTAGTGMMLNYRSRRVPGRVADYSRTIELTRGSIPAELRGIELEIEVAGRRFTQSFAPAPNLSYIFTWDGMDGFGRPVQGKQPATVRIGYVYPRYYTVPASVARSFGLTCGGSSGGSLQSCLIPSTLNSSARQEGTRWFEQTVALGGLDARAQGLGGWTLDVHHSYDPVGKVLSLGNGTRRSAAGSVSVLQTVAPLGGAQNIAIGPDGSIYRPESYAHRIYRQAPDGTNSVIAGNGKECASTDPCGDGGPATLASIYRPHDIALGPDGSVYVSQRDHNRIRRIGPDGIITTVAGTGVRGYSGDGGPGAQAQLSWPRAIAVDPSGNLYIADETNNRIRRVGTDGIIHTVVGTGTFSHDRRDSIPGTQLGITNPYDVAVGPSGDLFFVQYNENTIRRLGADGIVYRFAGTGEICSWLPCGDGGPARAAKLALPEGIAVGRDGSVYIADNNRYLIHRVSPDGIILNPA